MSEARHCPLLILGSGPAGYTAAVYAGSAPSANTWVKLRVETHMASASDIEVEGFINDVGLGGGTVTSNAITPATPLTPFVVCANRGAAVRNLLIDYIRVGSLRDE